MTLQYFDVLKDEQTQLAPAQKDCTVYIKSTYAERWRLGRIGLCPYLAQASATNAAAAFSLCLGVWRICV